MNILLLGATGDLGSRVVPALLSHSHKVTVLVRSKHKLLLMMPPSIFNHITVAEGDATDSTLIANLLRERHIDDMVNAAGHARLIWWPWWEENRMAGIVRASVEAVGAVAEESGRSRPLRAWFVGGMLLMDL